MRDIPDAVKVIDWLPTGCNWLDFENCHLNDDDVIRIVSRYPHLKNLSLANNSAVTDRGIKAIGKLRDLQSLCVDGCHVSPEIGLTCARMPALAHMRFSSNYWSPADKARWKAIQNMLPASYNAQWKDMADNGR